MEHFVIRNEKHANIRKWWKQSKDMPVSWRRPLQNQQRREAAFWRPAAAIAAINGRDLVCHAQFKQGCHLSKSLVFDECFIYESSRALCPLSWRAKLVTK
jgi:hypothetical protein